MIFKMTHNIYDYHSDTIELFRQQASYLRLFKRAPNYSVEVFSWCSQFYVDHSKQHTVLAIQCLNLMTKDLKKHICPIPDGKLNRKVGDLHKLQQQYIGNALEYACRFFAGHIHQVLTVGEYVDHIAKLLRIFAECHTFPWLEVLSIIGDMRAAVHSLNDIK